MKPFGKELDVDRDRMVLKIGADGVAGPCYFCGATVMKGSDFAVLMIERVDPRGDPIHAVCHGACAERAKSL